MEFDVNLLMFSKEAILNQLMPASCISVVIESMCLVHCFHVQPDLTFHVQPDLTSTKLKTVHCFKAAYHLSFALFVSFQIYCNFLVIFYTCYSKFHEHIRWYIFSDLKQLSMCVLFKLLIRLLEVDGKLHI